MFKKKVSMWTIIVFFSAILPLFVLNSSSAFAKKIIVITTSTDLKSIAEYIGGNKVKVDSITKGYQNPHIVDPKPSYMLKLNKADLFIKVGLDLELWAQLLEDGARNPRIRYGSPGYVDASVGVELLQIPQTRITRAMGDIHVFGNPHYWLDPLNGKKIAQNILKGLKKISPENANYFEDNKRLFDKKIDASLVKWLEKIKPYTNTNVIAYHKTWPNLTKRFGFKVVEYIEPKPGIPPSPSHIKNLIMMMRIENIKLIIKEPYYENKVPEFISSKTGARVLTLPTSVEGISGIKDYFALFDFIIDKLVNTYVELGINPND
ncbi:MAG: metal ABC transporter substrate-binding protein [Candidatus Scalinduaceae bacterium]